HLLVRSPVPLVERRSVGTRMVVPAPAPSPRATPEQTTQQDEPEEEEKEDRKAEPVVPGVPAPGVAVGHLGARVRGRTRGALHQGDVICRDSDDQAAEYRRHDQPSL